MPLETKFFNLDDPLNGWVRSFEQPSRVDAPIFGLNDNRDFEVVFLRMVSVSQAEKVTDAVAARIGLSNAGVALEPSATAGAPDNYAFPFVLPVSGTNIAALMAGKTAKQRVDAEFLITTALGTNRFYTYIYIAPPILSAAIPDPSVTEPATTISEVSGIFIQKEPPVNARMIWTDETTGQKYSVGFRDGQFHADLLT
jgi:hypothetical protein